MLVLPNEIGNTVTVGIINNLKHRIITIEQSIDIKLQNQLEPLTKRIHTLEQSQQNRPTPIEQLPINPPKEVTTDIELLVKKLENEVAKHNVIITDLQQKVMNPADLPSLIERLDTRLDSICIPVESTPKTEQNGSQVLRRQRGGSTKRLSLRFSDYFPDPPLRSNSVSSNASSGYTSDIMTHQDSIGGESKTENLSPIDEREMTLNNTDTPLKITEQQSFDVPPSDIGAVKRMVMDTLTLMNDLLEVLNSLGLDNQTNSGVIATV